MILNILNNDESMIKYVQDRPGHDLRYSLDCSKLMHLGWSPEYEFKRALEDTVKWYVENRWWWEKLRH
jgi:dTDP-glucose 4,6-dehydratase